MPRRVQFIALEGALAAVLAGCSGSPLPATLGVAVAQTAHAEPPVEIYSRVARGALGCWFGVHGSLKKTHIFHAEVAPLVAGGGAEIVLHERDRAQVNPRSIRAYRITIDRSGDGATMLAENFRLPEAVAADMRDDIGRWASGKTGCSVVGAGGWSAKPGVEPAPAAALKKKGKP